MALVFVLGSEILAVLEATESANLVIGKARDEHGARGAQAHGVPRSIYHMLGTANGTGLLVGGLTMGQLLCLPMIAAGLYLLKFGRNQRQV